jgi:cell division protease FtsH
MKKTDKNGFYFSGYKNLLLAAVIILVSVSFLTTLDYSSRIEDINYSKFTRLVADQKVKKLYVVGQEAQGILQDDTHFAVRLPEGTNWKDLVQDSSIDVTFGAASSQSSYWFIFSFLSFLIALLVAWYFLRQSRGSNNNSGGPNIFNMGKSRARLFMPSTIQIKFSDVAGAYDAKHELQNVINYLKHPEKYRRIGAKMSRGILLVGEPGNGKTLLAKAVAGEANVPFFSITGSDFIEVFVGVGAARVRDLFAQARKHAPCIIFIDEIDAIGRTRGSGIGGGHDEREQTLNQLLTEMDGFATTGGNVIVLAATNMPEVLDKALLRPGRFDSRIDVPYPDEVARHMILKMHAKTLKLAEDIDLEQLAKDTAGFSGAEIADLMNKAAVQAARNNQDIVTNDDIRAAKHIIVTSQKAIKPALTGESSLARMYKPAQIKTTFASVAGLDNAKEELQDIVNFLKDPVTFSRLGAQISKGVLMVGEPGNGKTLLARAMAGEANCPFFSISGSEFIQKYVGVGASRVRDLFAQARKHKPCIIFIDEIDSIGGHRRDESPEQSQTLNQLLTELDGFDTKEEAIIIIGATNRPDTLDKALLRPGRFDRQVQVPSPLLKDRLKILQLHAKDFKIDPSVDLERIARGTPGFSGADLKNIINEAAVIATKNPEQESITMAEFEEARDKIMVGKTTKSMDRTPEELKETAYHEAGHALMRVLQPELAMPLHKVTILARGDALGIAWALPEADQLGRSKDEMLAEIRVAMGGRAAEELVFGKQLTGAHSDLKNATHKAQEMVRYHGMDSDLGPVVYDVTHRHSYSQKTAEMIDLAVKNIVQSALDQVKKALQDNRDKLDRLANALLEHETLDAVEVYELLGMPARQDKRFVQS